MLDWDNLRIFLALARGKGLTDAAKKLGIDHTTVLRRMKRLEAEVGSQLFERSTLGYLLTPQGQRLAEYVERIEQQVHEITDDLGGLNRTLAGQVRLGATEGFGSTILAPQLAHFCRLHPNITVDILTVPRFVNLPKREADLAVIIDRPQTGSYVVTRMSEYRLKLYATAGYLERSAPIRRLADLDSHAFITYLEDLLLSDELRYMDRIAPNAARKIQSSSVIAQYMAVQRGVGLAILPCFLAQQCDDLVPVLDDEIDLVRSFWLVSPTELRHTARVAALWDYLLEVGRLNHAYLMGISGTQVFEAVADEAQGKAPAP
jgi:DNA-binding transcriptional LysR family regulator